MSGPFEHGSGDSRADEIARLARDTYHVPPDPPVEAMWAEIERHTRDVRPLPVARRRWARAGGWAVAASAILALGVGLGRWSALEQPGVAVSADAPGANVAEATPSAGMGVLWARHLESSESLLSLIRADARAGTLDREVGQWGRTLLLETRLLLDAAGDRDPALRELLLDLELVLAQVALLDTTESPDRAREELDLILQGLENQSMMARIQSALPAAASGLSGT